MNRTEMIKWLAENTVPAQWKQCKPTLGLTAKLTTKERGAWGTRKYAVASEVADRYVQHPQHGSIHFTDVFPPVAAPEMPDVPAVNLNLDQPAYIDGAVYECVDRSGDHNGEYQYDLSLNRFKRWKAENTWFGASSVGDRISVRRLVFKRGEEDGLKIDPVLVDEELLTSGFDKPENDPVYKPKHYEIFRGIEAKDVMRLVAESELVSHLSPWEIHCFMTMLKYRLRAGEKDALQQDIDKANRYRDCLEK